MSDSETYPSILKPKLILLLAGKRAYVALNPPYMRK